MSANQEFLSQDEVDALLKGVAGEESGQVGAAGAATESGVVPVVRRYNMATQEPILRGRMPVLEIIHERFVRQFRVGLFNFMRRTAAISAGPIRILKYSEFISSLAAPTNLNLVQAKPLRGTALFIFDPNLVYLVVDNLFGGDGRFQKPGEGREFTLTEQRIIRRLLDVVLKEYEQSCKPVFELKFEFLRSELTAQYVHIATPNEMVVATTFNVEFGSTSGEFHVCMPYAMLEPVRDKLNSSAPKDQLEVDKRWLRLLAQQVQTAEVEMVAMLGRTEVTLQQILQMKPGDVIALDIPESITATIDGIEMMQCRYGMFNGQYALKVEKVLAGATNE